MRNLTNGALPYIGDESPIREKIRGFRDQSAAVRVSEPVWFKCWHRLRLRVERETEVMDGIKLNLK